MHPYVCLRIIIQHYTHVITTSLNFHFFNFLLTISLSKGEFEEGQDDMAFVTSSDINKITIANDVITLPDFASAKSRLSVR